jgi:hypothetical protein
MAELRLPDRFRDLEPLAEHWALPTEAERHAKRLNSTIVELRALYDALFPRIEDILGYLSEFEVDKLTPEGQHLLRLAFALAEIGPAIELYGVPEVPDGFDSRRFIAAPGQ